MYFDKSGKPIDRDEWSRLFHDLTYKRIAYTDLPDGSYLSTVWLGIDHGFGGRKVLFESMRGPTWDVCERYETEEEARRGHARLLLKIRSDLAAHGRRRLPRKAKKRAKRRVFPGQGIPTKHIRVRPGPYGMEETLTRRGYVLQGRAMRKLAAEYRAESLLSLGPWPQEAAKAPQPSLTLVRVLE